MDIKEMENKLEKVSDDLYRYGSGESWLYISKGALEELRSLSVEEKPNLDGVNIL